MKKLAIMFMACMFSLTVNASTVTSVVEEITVSTDGGGKLLLFYYNPFDIDYFHYCDSSIDISTTTDGGKAAVGTLLTARSLGAEVRIDYTVGTPCTLDAVTIL